MKHRECEDLRNKYYEALRNKDKGMATHVDEMEAEIKKH